MSLILLGILNSQVTGGGAGAYDLLETQVLTSSASSVTFTGLDTLAAGYQHLQIRYVARSSENATYSILTMRFNSDTASNYAYHRLEGDGSTVASSGGGGQPWIISSLMPGATATANSHAAGVIDLLDFNSTSKYTTARVLGGQADTQNSIALRSGVWLNTSALTSVTLLDLFSSNLVTGSRFSLYGVK